MNDLLPLFPGTSGPLSRAMTQPLTASWQSPSNIAFVKYWGKLPQQRPMNPSLSMTLHHAVTRTTVTTLPGEQTGRIAQVNGDTAHPFTKKLQHLLDVFLQLVPGLNHWTFSVETENTFPHSTGIASSASGLSAFALCLLDIAVQAFEPAYTPAAFTSTASRLARMGSGSACRSVFGGFAVWGETPLVNGSSDDEAVSLNHSVHPVFQRLHDAILVVSSTPKSLSSSAGHQAMDSHPYRAGRMAQAEHHLVQTIAALASGNVEELAQVTEAEAFALHALIMTSGTLLMQPATLAIIHHIREARRQGLPVWFTLDAGANVHMLYPGGNAVEAESFINATLRPLCEEGTVILDRCGDGPVKIS